MEIAAAKKCIPSHNLGAPNTVYGIVSIRYAAIGSETFNWHHDWPAALICVVGGSNTLCRDCSISDRTAVACSTTLFHHFPQHESRLSELKHRYDS